MAAMPLPLPTENSDGWQVQRLSLTQSRNPGKLDRRFGFGVKGMDRRIKQAVEIMEREPGHPLLVSKISVLLGLSESRFEHLFREEIGQAFKTYLEELRLRKAKDLLLDPTLRIKEIAAAVGYTYPCNFTRDFRKRYGKTPSQYRIPSA